MIDEPKVKIKKEDDDLKRIIRFFFGLSMAVLIVWGIFVIDENIEATIICENKDYWDYNFIYMKRIDYYLNNLVADGIIIYYNNLSGKQIIISNKAEFNKNFCFVRRTFEGINVDGNHIINDLEEGETLEEYKNRRVTYIFRG